MKKSLLILVTMFFLYDGLCQKPIVQWTSVIGGSKDEELNIYTLDIIDESLNFIEQTMDSGYIVICRTHSKDGDAIGNTAYSALITKIDNLGKKSWVKVLPNYSTIITYSIIANGIIIEYIIDKGDPKYLLSFISNDGNILWTKPSKQSKDRYSFNDKLLSINDTSFVIVGLLLKKIRLTYFDSNGEIFSEKILDSPSSIYELLGNVKTGITNNNKVYIAYSSNIASGTTIKYYSNIIVINYQGVIEWFKNVPGKFVDFFQTKTNDAFLLREINQGSTNYIFGREILINKYNQSGVGLFENISGGKAQFKDQVIARSFLTNDGGLLSSFGKSDVKYIDDKHKESIFFINDSIKIQNLIQSNSGDFLIQAITEPKESDIAVESKRINIYRLDNTGKLLWNKVLWNIKDGHIVSFFEVENDKFLVISKNDIGKKLSLYTIAILDNAGKTIGSLVFYGPTDSNKLLKRTLDGGFVIAGLIYKKDISISEYHGGSDIMIVKLGFSQ